MTPAEKLKAVCDEAVADPSFAPAAGKTYCNVAVQRVSKGMGLEGFAGLTANQIFERCSRGPEWRAAGASEAGAAANRGVLCLAAQSGRPHGHAAVLYPAPMEWSGKWGKLAPAVANVGAKNAVMGANWAFETEPTYFIFKGSA